MVHLRGHYIVPALAIEEMAAEGGGRRTLTGLVG
jgi:hypothetical protein